jgi:hypothetical protein
MYAIALTLIDAYKYIVSSSDFCMGGGEEFPL